MPLNSSNFLRYRLITLWITLNAVVVYTQMSAAMRPLPTMKMIAFIQMIILSRNVWVIARMTGQVIRPSDTSRGTRGQMNLDIYSFIANISNAARGFPLNDIALIIYISTACFYHDIKQTQNGLLNINTQQ